ncbi:MAG TPA: OsmC family protein [Fimbriimonadaceae bacterium]|nr:OsmC family protein [Fimbriimonadaceae bacterium]
MPTIHDYPVTVQWTGGRDGKGTFTAKHSGSTLPIAVPPEFQGVGGGASPEELLTSAIVSCYTLTFGIIAANRKIPVQDVQVEAVGQVEQNGPSFKYIAITLRPKITLAADATDEQMKLAEDMAHKADSYCIVTNAVRGNVQIVVEPTLARG